MRGDYPDDTFTESDVLACLEAAGLKYKRGGRYILSQCPLHEDENPSVQIYKDDWFVKCHAGCEGGRFHITKAFPSLRPDSHAEHQPVRKPRAKAPTVKYRDASAEIMALWQSLPEIPADHKLHEVPAETLNDLGWRWDAPHNRYLIPYWSRSKTSIPFAQWRNLSPNMPRFNFWKDTKPTMYGTFNLYDNDPVFLVEGCSDAAVMDYCAVPWIAAPSAASGELVEALAAWCKAHNARIIYAGDNDEAGDKLKDALDEVGMSYRRKQPRKPYKDWGEMLEAEGFESVNDYCNEELFPGGVTGTVVTLPEPVRDEFVPTNKTPLEQVQAVFPGATELKLVERG